MVTSSLILHSEVDKVHNPIGDRHYGFRVLAAELFDNEDKYCNDKRWMLFFITIDIINYSFSFIYIFFYYSYF